MEISRDQVSQFITHCQENELARNSIIAYRNDLNKFMEYLQAHEVKDVQKQNTIDYNLYLSNQVIPEQGKAATMTPKTAERRITTLNAFLKFIGAAELQVKRRSKLQNKNTLDNLLTLNEFSRLLEFAQKTRHYRARVIMIALACTGIRYNELKYLTVEALKAGFMTVNNKGTIREVPLNACKKELLDFCKFKGITKGLVFITRYGNPISNPQLSRELKAIAGKARGIKLDKVHCHAFRHLFSVNYLDNGGHLTELKDILGHKNLNTTAIYTKTTLKQLGRKMQDTSILHSIK